MADYDEADGIRDGEEVMAGVDPTELTGRGRMLAGVRPNGEGWHGPPPKRDGAGVLHWEDTPSFQPNMTPEEVLRAGSFGGGYFRSIKSSVTGQLHGRVWEELPEEWIEGLDVATTLSSDTYNKKINRYGVNCGAKTNKADEFGLEFWEGKGWINAQDPYGWFHWYCRFYQGRRSQDDGRQIERWSKVCGERGRWKQNLVGKVLASGKAYDDPTVSPVVRQTLQHWAYALTEADFEAGAKRVRTHGAAYMPRADLAHVMEQGAGKKGKGKCSGKRPKNVLEHLALPPEKKKK